MKLSIIVPVLNAAADGKLDVCMKSLLNQTIEEYEIVAVENASVDASLEILKEYEKQYPQKVKVVASEYDRNRGGALNLGLRNATGEWLAFVDCNHWVAPDCYERLLQEAERQNADIAGCQYQEKETRDVKPGTAKDSFYAQYEGKLDDAKHRNMILHEESFTAKIFKTSIFYDNGLWFSEDVSGEEIGVSLLAMLYGKCFAYVRKPLYFCTIQEACSECDRNLMMWNDRVSNMENLLGECYKRGFLEEYPEEIEYRFIKYFYVKILFEYTAKIPFFKQRVSYLRMLRDGMRAYFPEFASNSYYEELESEETKKLARLLYKSPFRFFLSGVFRRK